MKKTFFKTLALVLSILMALHAIPATALEELANTNNSFSETENEQSAVLESNNTSTETKEEHIYEDTSLREANTKHFKLYDGSYIAAQYPYAVHIKDESGSWKNIDNTLSDSGSDFSTGNARVKFAKKTTGNETLFTLHDGNYKITMSLNGATKKINGIVTNNTDAENDTELQKLMNLEKLSSSILYPEILNGVDLEYIVDSLNIKENIIVKTTQDNYSYSFTLKLNNLAATLNDDGSISIFDLKDSEIIYVIPAPIVYDASGVFADDNSAHYALEDQGNGKYALTVTADSEWMNADERTWPITIDPAIYVNLYDDMSDTFISSSSTSSSFGGYTYMDSGHGASGQEFITYWMPDILPSIPENAYIVSADLALHLRSYITSANVSELLLGVYPVTSSWTSFHTWTMFANGTNGSIGSLYECISIIPQNASQYVSFNITDIARQWIDGTLTNYGVAIRQIGTDRAYARFDATNKQSNMPRLTVKYHNPKGLESYWSYSTHNLPVGTGHVNLATGALTLVIPTLSTTEAIFGFTPSLVYNSGIHNEYNINENNDNVPHIVTSAGYGWQLNVNESVLKKTYIDADGASATYYILTDSDGTEHAFYLDKTTNTYKDEDGLLLTLTENSNYYHIEDSSHTIKSYLKITNNTSNNEGAVLNIITDKFGNKLKVYNYTNGRCNGIAFCPAGGSDVSHMTLSYNAGGCISAITNSTTGHKVTFEYSTLTSGGSSASSGGYLKKMIFSKTSGSTTTNYSIIEFSYRSSGELYIIKDTVTGKSIYYQYSSGKTTIVREKGEDTWGQTIRITYDSGTTSVRSSGKDDKYNNSDDIINHYTFDNKGRAISCHSSDVSGKTIYGASHCQYSDIAENKLKAKGVGGGTGVNYIANGNFSFGGSTYIDDWYTSSSRVTRYEYYNDYVLKILPKANTTDYANQYVSLEAGDYTLSLACETKKCENVSVKMSVIPMNGLGESYTKDIPINQNTTNGKASPNLTFNVPEDSFYEIKIEAVSGSSVNANSTVIIDNVMLEKNIGSSGPNIVTFSGFEKNALTAEGNYSFTQISDYWNFSTTDTSVIALNTDNAIRGDTLRINGEVGKNYYASQTINFPYENSESTITPARFYKISGFGKGSHQTSSGYFGLIVTVTLLGDITTKEYIPFNNQITELQYAGGIIAISAESVIKSIEIACVYSNNPGTAYFDDISIIQIGRTDATQYVYDESTKLLIEEITTDGKIFYHYSNGNLIRQADTHNNYKNYTYANNILISEDSGTIDSFEDGLLPSVALKDMRYETLAFVKTDYTYNSYGLITQTDTYNPINAYRTILTTSATYNTDLSSKNFGVLLSSTDENGNTVQYAYDSSGKLQYQVNADGTSGLYYTYDNIDRLSKVTPLTYSSISNSYNSELSAESVDYIYNSLHQLSEVNTDTSDYTFTYDLFGNTTSVNVGDYTLATYTYNANNGKLATMNYGNGTTVSYSYDALDRVEKICYNGNIRYEYQYTAEGKLHSVTDLASGIGYLYEYDGEDRIVGYVQYNLNNKTNTLGILYTYDEKSRLFEATTTIDYSIGTDTTTQSLLEQYLYNDETNTLSDYMVLFGHYSGENIKINYTYDSIQRPTSKTYTLKPASTLTNTVQYTYCDRTEESLLSSQIKTYSTTVGNNVTLTYTYTYDSNGNVTEIQDSSLPILKRIRYYYDDLGQLIREDNPYKGACYTYTYDNNGNRTSKSTYAYATGTSGTATSTQTYTYGDATWGDKLTAFNGVSITYDSIGNPLSYYNGTSYTFTWSDGRRLATATKGGVSYSFTYNDEGIRTSKTVGGVKHSYTLEGTRIISEQWGNNLIIYLYDEAGSPIGMLYRTNSYAVDTYDIFYFEKNLQGDIIAIYNAAGTKLVGYTYDAWGNCTTTYYNGGGSTAAQYNPFRYRGYYYDADLGLYYLNSRYYDPNTGRFLNADGSLYQHLLGYNMYAYCVNSPIAYTDPTGQWFIIDDLVTGPVDELIVVGCIVVIVLAVNCISGNNSYNGIETYPSGSGLLDPLWNGITTTPSTNVDNSLTHIPNNPVDSSPIIDTPISNGNDTGILETPASNEISTGIVLSKTHHTPLSHPQDFTKLRGDQGLKDVSGNIWKIDKLHKNHFDISNSKGKKIREVNFEGIQIWPNGAKNKNKH